MYPNPSSGMVHGSEHLRLFEFLGRILGKALYEGITVRIGWPPMYARRPGAENCLSTPRPLPDRHHSHPAVFAPAQNKTHTLLCLSILCFILSLFNTIVVRAGFVGQFFLSNFV